jgi:hypothetical protein
MAVAFIQEFAISGRGTANYDAVNKRLTKNQPAREGLLIHFAGFDDEDGVFRIVNVWETREQGQAYLDEHVMPAVRAVLGDVEWPAPPDAAGVLRTPPRRWSLAAPQTRRPRKGIRRLNRPAEGFTKPLLGLSEFRATLLRDLALDEKRRPGVASPRTPTCDDRPDAVVHRALPLERRNAPPGRGPKRPCRRPRTPSKASDVQVGQERRRSVGEPGADRLGRGGRAAGRTDGPLPPTPSDAVSVARTRLFAQEPPVGQAVDSYP